MSERNLPEVMCVACAGHQRNVNDARWNVALEDTVRTQMRLRVWITQGIMFGMQLSWKPFQGISSFRIYN